MAIMLVIGTGFVFTVNSQTFGENQGESVNIENVESITVNITYPVMGGAMMGAAGDSGFTNVVASGDITAGDDVVVGDDLTVTGDVAVSGNLDVAKGVTTQSSSTNETLTATQICDYGYLAYTPIQSLTLTLPATSTITSCLGTAGVSMSYIIENAATTTMNITLAAGTGMDLQEPDGQNVVIGQNNYAYLTFTKQSSGDIVVRVDETIPAD